MTLLLRRQHFFIIIKRNSKEIEDMIEARRNISNYVLPLKSRSGWKFENRATEKLN